MTREREREEEEFNELRTLYRLLIGPNPPWDPKRPANVYKCSERSSFYDIWYSDSEKRGRGCFRYEGMKRQILRIASRESWNCHDLSGDELEESEEEE